MLLNNFIKNAICVNIVELKEYKSFYEKKTKIDRKVIYKINILIEKSIQKRKENLINTLNKLQENLNSYEKNILLIDESIDVLENMQKDCLLIENPNDELKQKIDKYNIKYAKIKENYKEHIIHMDNILLDYMEIQEKEENTETINSNIIEKKEQDNNILLISEIQNKVILPYKIEKLNKILNSEENKYKDLQEIIDEKYTIPLVNYKNSAISRFKEAFSLMRNKEKSSFMDAVDLAFELMGNRYLNPAIITACENLDQLDVYLDCLDTNELEEFPFFEIKYELYPVKVKTKEFVYDDIIPKRKVLGFLTKS